MCQRPGERESGKDVVTYRGLGSQPSAPAGLCGARAGGCVFRGGGDGQCQASPPGPLGGQEYAHCFSFCFHRIKYGSKKTVENTAHFKYLHVTNEGFVRARNVMQPNCAIRRVITGFIENINSSVRGRRGRVMDGGQSRQQAVPCLFFLWCLCH